MTRRFILLALLCSACVRQPPTITRAAYDRLYVGMSRQHAEAVIGRAGTEISRESLSTAETVPKITTIYRWQNLDRSSMWAMFRDGLLVNKEQAGLP